MASRLKKIAMDFGDRDFAIAYIDGEVFSANTHANCINEYLMAHSIECLNAVRRRPNINNIDTLDNADVDERLSKYEQEDLNIIRDNITQVGFAHVVDGSNENSGYYEDEDGRHIYIERDTLYNVDFNTVVNAIKQSYPNYDIHIEETEEKVARLKRLAEDSSYVAPNGVTWNDDIWDTYESIDKKTKPTISREWVSEQPIDNAEWAITSN